MARCFPFMLAGFLVLLGACQTAPAPMREDTPEEEEAEGPPPQQLEQVFESSPQTVDAPVYPTAREKPARKTSRSTDTPPLLDEVITSLNELPAVPPPGADDASGRGAGVREPESRFSSEDEPPEVWDHESNLSSETPPLLAETIASLDEPAPSPPLAWSEEVYLLPAASAPSVSSGKGAPLAAQEAVPVGLTPFMVGSWTSEGASMTWRLRLKSVGASSLSLYLNPLHLPPGAQLTLSSPDGRTSHGPYTAADIPKNGQFWTPSVPGGTAVLGLRLSSQSASSLRLNIAQVRIGYRAE